jgi:hypothetical protein
MAVSISLSNWKDDYMRDILLFLALIFIGFIVGLFFMGAYIDSCFTVKTKYYTAYFLTNNDPCSKTAAWGDVLLDGLASSILRRGDNVETIHGYVDSECQNKISKQELFVKSMEKI